MRGRRKDVDVDPGLLTYEEYRHLVNPKGIEHPSSAYEHDLKKMNSFRSGKAQYPILLNRKRIDGLTFEFRLDKRDRWERRHVKTDADGEIVRGSDGEILYWERHDLERLGYRRWEYGIAVFEGDNRVAFSDDEWGCVLVVVAREYRGFGLGPIVGKIARTLEPGKTSGGFTASGAVNFIKVHREFVRDKLVAGAYSRMVREGLMTAARAKEIVASAGLPAPREAREPIDLSSDDPGDWLLHVGEHGDFVLYDRKLPDILERGGRFDFFAQRMIKGMVHAHADGRWCRIKTFGGEDDRVRRFMMTLALEHARNEGVPLAVEPEDLPHVNRSRAEVDETAGVGPGYRSYAVRPKGDPIDLRPLAASERKFRARFDRYGEFLDRLLEEAYAKWQPDTVEAECRFGW